MHVEFRDDTNRSKKRVTKQMRENFSEDKGFAASPGSTVPDAKAFDALETACEDIETKAQLVANQLNRDEALRLQHPTEFSPPAGIAGFHNAVKKGIAALKQTNFNGLPRSDIASLESYLERLSDFDFEAKFAALSAYFAPGAPGAQFPEEQNIRMAIQAATDEIALENRNLADEYQRIGIAPGQPIVGMAKAARKAHEGIVYRFENRRAFFERQLNDLEHDLARGLQPVNTKATRGKLVDTDTMLVVPQFKVFLESLANGLQSHSSGVSGRTALIDNSNRDALANPLRKNELQGHGRYHLGMGGAEYLPKRYL